MAGPFDFTGQNIENTYQRVLQTDGINIYDGTGSAFTVTAVAAPAGPNQSIQFNDANTTSGSGNFTFDKNTNTVSLTGSFIIDTASSDAALRVTQTGTGNAILVEDSTNPDSTPFVVMSDGKVLIGTTTPTTSVLTLVGNQSVTGNVFVTNAVQSGTADRLFLGASATANSYFNTGGNVGIGTISPIYRLDVSGSSRITGDLIVTGIIDGGTF